MTLAQPTPRGSASPFRSFWMGGYECTDQQNCFGNRVDFLPLTGHLQNLENDYLDLAPFHIQTVREGIRWSQVEKRAYQYDWSDVEIMIRTGQRLGIQQVWDLCHFGYPDDLTPLHPMFARRFTALCRAFVSFYRSLVPDGKLIVTPVNEVSFISWLGGDVRGTVPYCNKQGWEVKYGLMRAYIEGVAAIREIDPSVLVMTTEPLVSMVPPLNATRTEKARAAEAHRNQFQATDMLTGRLCPELGGSPRFLDILGLNYYYNNQWVVPTFEFLPWMNEHADPRWRPLSDLMTEAYRRYRKPIVLSETSHPGIDRPGWIRFVGDECARTIQNGVPLWGVCLYPIIDRPDWDHPTRWHRSGLWDADLPDDSPAPAEPYRRILYEPYAAALLQAQAVVRQAQESRKKAVLKGI